MPDDPSVMDTLGWVYYRKGIYDSAIGEFKGSLAKAPDNADGASTTSAWPMPRRAKRTRRGPSWSAPWR